MNQTNSSSGTVFVTSTSENGERVAICSGNSAQLLDSRTGDVPFSPLVHEETVSSAHFSPDASRLVTLSGANAYVWNTQTGTLAYPSLKHPVPVVYAEFSRDGGLLVTCCADSRLTKCFAQVWNVETGRLVSGPLRHGDGVLSASFSRDGTRLVTASEDFTAKVWDVNTGEQIGFSLRHSSQVDAAAFSHNGQWIATASADYTARLWDAQSGDPISPPLPHLTVVTGVGFLPNDDRLVTSDGQGRSFEWQLPFESRTPSSLIELTSFLTGGQFLSSDTSTNQPEESVSTIWRRLHAKYPRDFSVSFPDILRWHEFQVDESESKEQWSAAAFHLNCLMRLRPGDQAVTQDFARVQEILHPQNWPRSKEGLLDAR